MEGGGCDDVEECDGVWVVGADSSEAMTHPFADETQWFRGG